MGMDTNGGGVITSIVLIIILAIIFGLGVVVGHWVL